MPDNKFCSQHFFTSTTFLRTSSPVTILSISVADFTKFVRGKGFKYPAMLTLLDNMLDRCANSAAACRSLRYWEQPICAGEEPEHAKSARGAGAR